MVIVPDSKIKLIKNPLKLDNNNEITFTNATAQYNYFNSLPKLEYSGMTYVRKDGVIRVQTKDDTHATAPTYEDLLQYNFCMYQNTHFSNKWFYAFITDIKWINPSLTEIQIKTAYFQTWQFDLVYADSFIEREHVTNDNVGEHTIPEGLETGDYICYSTTDLFSAGTCYIAVGVTEVVDEISQNPFNTRYNGIYSGIKYILCETPLAATNLIRGYDKKGKGDAIALIFLIPSSLTGSVTWSTITIEGITTQIAILPYSDSAQLLNTVSNITVPPYFGTYQAINNKLKVYPYNYFYVTNNVGQDVVYHYEDFASNTASFKTYGAITPGCSIKCVPLNYKKLLDSSTPSQTLNSYNYGIMGGKLPMCSWNSDPYTNWLTQNGINIAGQSLNQQEASGLAGIGSMIVGGIMMATGVGGLAGAGLMAGGAAGIYNSMQSNYQKDITPLQSKGSTSGGDVQYSTGTSKIQLFKMTIRPEYAKAIDQYFLQFGYKVNRLGKPHIHVRTYYDYCKTIDVNIEGNVPESDLEEIRKMFNNGIRFWHDTTKYLDFSVNNSIITP